QAMHLVHKGLEAMQALQAQTARAHEKFLDTQARATQTLAAMMSHTREFVDGISPVPDTSPVMPRPADIPASQPVNSPAPQLADNRASAPAAPLPEQPPLREKMNTTASPRHTHSDPPVTAAPSPACASAKIQSVLFDIVSRLTGFPEEMLEPDMDIESDLGVDSIKKVEIISELEKQLPDTRGLTTENIGTARTLADICRAISSEVSETSEAPSLDTVFSDTPGSSESDISESDMPGADTSESAAGAAAGTDTQTAGTSCSDPNSDSRVMDVIVTIISELTGFPQEMLEPGMDLESDLGVDSIKRVEILSRLEQTLGDTASRLSGDDMAGLKTIRDMVSFLDQAPCLPEPEEKKNASSGDDAPKPPENPDLTRQTIHLEKISIQQVRFFNGSKIQVPDTGKIYITRDQAGMADPLIQAFHKQGQNAELLDFSSENIPDLTDAAGLVIVQNQLSQTDTADAIAFLKTAFALVHKNGRHLQTSAAQKGAFLATVTFSGGGFGIPPYGFDTLPEYGGLAGLAKTAALEWKDVLCHALDLPNDPEAWVECADAAAALMMTQGPVEMGLGREHCRIPTLETVPVQPGRLNFSPHDVVVITGGARGVTAACAEELAKTGPLTLVLLGRSAPPFDEPDWAKSLSDPGELKKAILTHEFAGKKPTPANLEKRFQAICANRQIQQTLAQIRSHGSEAVYVSTDIREPEAVKAALDQIRSRFNTPIAGIIHGAGVLEDKWIVDKHPDQFNRVFDTKVDGLNALIQATQTDPLKYMIVFSSIAARTGNPGQCDYAMANEVLNKCMGDMAAKKPDCKCLAINWGPWDGGMVHDGLKQVFAKKGVGLIPISAGARQLIREMANPEPNHTEIVITAPTIDLKNKKTPKLSLVSQMVISRKTVPIITSHRINHEPVVPFALMAEIMAHAAEKNHPGLVLTGLDDLRLLKGIRPGNRDVRLAVNVSRCTCTDTRYLVFVSLTSVSDDNDCVTHATATAVLKNTLPDPPVLSGKNRMDLSPCQLSVKAAYETVLFHGKDLQAITAISGISDKGIEVTATMAPSPDHWFETPPQTGWTTDPLLVDAAFQAAILWTWETRKQVCLPSFVAGLRIYSSFRQVPAENAGIHILFTVNENTDHQIKGYFTFFDDLGNVTASIMGFEAVVDTALHDKFKPEPLFDKKAILAFAQGNPSDAFGARYQIFDKDRQIARLPRPPYFFMDRVLTADHVPWQMQPDGWIETAYDVPADAWYFTANYTRTLPFCILLEIALQPCGWLAAYAGSALHSEDRLHFRNLGGTARCIQEVSRDAGTLLVRVRLTDVSKAGDMILQSFDMQVTHQGQTVYEGTTRFGFFTAQALASQKGIQKCALVTDTPAVPREPIQVFPSISPRTPADLSMGPDTGMPGDALRMIDAIEVLDPSGGKFNHGYVRAQKTVDPKEWFFDAHFYQDPVCPGSLGIESFLQTLRYYLLETFSMDPSTHDVSLVLGDTHEWVYRGQIIPTHKVVTIHTHIRQVSQENNIYAVKADGALCVDGRVIYEMKNFGLAFAPVGLEKTRDHLTRIFVPA
ncbi:MAG: SDR family NAD(P)-dependent oxidoreductase, partial [Desulfotignum sp.]|nr:SDR family NAD(P)-dependent oxidoreductase [Desulfotignum sp.]